MFFVSFINKHNELSVNRTAALNIISVVVLQGISFLTAPIFTRLLGAEQYGVFSVYNAWVAVLTCFMGLNVSSALGTGMYQFKNEYYQFRSSIFMLGTVISGIISIVILLISDNISLIIGYSRSIVVLIILMSISNYITGFAQSAYIYEKKPFNNLIISLVIALSSTLFSLILIYHYPQGEKYYARILGNTIPCVLISLVIWFFVFMKRPTRMKAIYCKFALTMGIPVVFHLLSQKILIQSDRLMMKHMGVDIAEIGIYSIYYALTSVLNTLLTALNHSWCPYYFDVLNANEHTSLNKKSKNYIELMTVLSCGFILLSREVGYIYAGEEYYSGIKIIPILVLAVFFTFMYQFPVNFEFYYKKTSIMAIGTAGAAITNIILNILMIPLYGIVGAATATAISYGLLFIAHYIVARKIMKEKFHLSIKAFAPSLFIILISIILFYLTPTMWYLRWGLGIVIGVFEILRIRQRKSIF